MKIWGFNLPGTPWATSACRGTPLLLIRNTCIAFNVLNKWYYYFVNNNSLFVGKSYIYIQQEIYNFKGHYQAKFIKYKNCNFQI